MKKNLLIISFCLLISVVTLAQQITINGPAGSGSFGNVTVLTNGNYVIADISYSEGPATQIGAVHLYNGITHQLISTLKGSTTNDQVGNAVYALNNGNFVVVSTQWNNGAVVDAGAVTWCNGITGINGVVSSINSLVGSTANDQVGNGGITPLSNGNYIVRTTTWDNGAAFDAGAITWGNGISGVTGAISSSNSLVGSTANDQVGQITLLSNGNFVVYSANWDNGAIANAGAATWCNGSTGISGVVSSSNSLVGSTSGDFTGYIRTLSNGNYLVVSPDWDNPGITSNVGAVTWCNGTTGRNGVINSTNSLVGSTFNDRIGVNGIEELSTGNYVVVSRNWDNGSISNAGAVTWGNGSTGATGLVSISNSLVGSTLNDQIGNRVTTLNNGNYVVASSSWDNGSIVNAGAVTWCNGTTGRTGAINSTNSLIGSTADDQIGNINITVLSNGNYVVASPSWDNGSIVNAGAVTWCNGTVGRTGTISSASSLVGSTANDNVGGGGGGITVLSNANYVVTSISWDNGSVVDAGAVTWCDGTIGRTGAISSANSLVGTTLNDQVGIGGITPLSNGNYLVRSYFWNNGSITDAGAITLGNGTTGIAGTVSIANSLVGSTANDNIGLGTATALLTNGNCVIASNNWDNGAVVDAGAVTWINGTTGISGTINSSNSLVGITSGDMNLIGINRLANNNFIVRIPSWNNGAVVDAGAVAWGSGTTGILGIISNSNSLIGSSTNDQVGFNPGILPNGNYLVISPFWDNGAATDAGAVTWGNGSSGTTGVVSSANSLVGTTTSDQVGNNGVTALGNGNYYFRTNLWDNGAITNAGAVTWGNGSTGVTGTINSCNSVTGSVTGSNINPTYNTVYDYLIAAIPISNKVVIYNPVGQALANHLDVVTTSINGSNAVPFITSPSCRIIGTLTPNGANPVSGVVNAQAWIESSVPNVAGQPFVARHYEITSATNPATTTGRVTLYFTQQEFTDFNNDPGSILDLPTGPADAAGKANLRVEKRTGTSSNGTGLPGSYGGINSTIDPADADIVWNATLSRWEVSFDVTGFSGFFVKTTPSVLPLTLLEFNGRLQNGDVLLNWKTENEVNTEKFLVERSIDGRNFSSIGTVAARNQPGANLYNYTDAGVITLAASMVYYRLKQTDIDSRFTYSRIIALPLSKQNNLMLYPNPASDVLMITLSAGRAEIVRVRVMDNAGRIVRQQQWNMTAGSATMQLEVSGLAKGMYYLEVKGETIDQRKTFIRQ